jgi:hypothetical protein
MNPSANERVLKTLIESALKYNSTDNAQFWLNVLKGVLQDKEDVIIYCDAVRVYNDFKECTDLNCRLGLDADDIRGRRAMSVVIIYTGTRTPKQRNNYIKFLKELSTRDAEIWRIGKWR